MEIDLDAIIYLPIVEVRSFTNSVFGNAIWT